MLTYDWNTASLKIDDLEMVSFLEDQYRENRYLASVPDNKLYDRLHGLAADCIVIDSLGFPRFQARKGEKAILVIELMEEFRIRNEDADKILVEALNRFANYYQQDNVRRIQNQLLNLDGKKCLFKFTKAKYVNDLLNGKVRFKTASSYNAEGFNIAIRDDELNIEYMLKNLRMTLDDGTTIPVNNNQITVKAAGDYFVSCFSVEFNMKLFKLFECDSCVAIINADEFVKAVKSRFKTLYPEFNIVFGPVEYIDPFRQLKSKRPIEFRKLLHFCYEKEYRFVAFPLDSNRSLQSEQIITIDSGNFEYYTIQIDD